MTRVKFFFLSGFCSLFLLTAANAQDINQATEFYNKGAEATTANNWTDALTNFNQALEIAEQLGEEGADMSKEIKGLIPSIHLYIAQDMAKASDIDGAMAELKKALETAQKYGDEKGVVTDAQDLMKQLEMKTATDFLTDKKYAEAIAAFKKIVETEPDNGAAYLRLGLAYAGSGNETETINAYTKAIELGQKEAMQPLTNIYLKDAQAALKEKKWSSAYDFAKKATEVSSDNVNANFILGSAAIGSKKFAEAAPALEKVLSSNPAEPMKSNVIYQLASAYEGLGKNSEACAYYKQLLNNATYKAMAEHKIKNVLKCQ